MATPVDIERLDALVKRLTPLSSTASGELIRADDWNTLVLAIVELARTVHAEAQDSSIPKHSHFDEVSMAWLDKQLRTLISGGSLKDPIQEGKLNSLERKFAQLYKDLSARKDDITRLLKELDQVATKALERENQVQRLDRQVSGLRSANDEVGELRLTLNGLRDQIITAQSIADQLRDPSGKLVDVAAIQSDVSDLLSLREQLKDANGEVISGMGIDQKIAAALNTLVTEEELLEALDDRFKKIDSQLNNDIKSQVSSSLDQAISTSLNEFRQQITRENTKLFEGLNQTISRTVADQLPAIRDSITKNIQSELSQSLQTLKNDFDQSLKQNREALRAEFIKADSDLRSHLSTEFQQKIDVLEKSQDVSLRDSMNFLQRSFETEIARNNNELSAMISKSVGTVLDRRLAEMNISNDHSGKLLTEVDTAIEKKIDASFRTLGLTDELIGIDDFTALQGIGATYHNRLQSAKIRSYEQLAQLSPEQVAGIINLSVDRVKELDVIGQAQKLSKGSL